MKKLLLFLSLLPMLSIAQALLKPGIGIGHLPDNNDAICTIPWYLGSFDSSGLQTGDTAFDFKLYDLQGDSFSLSEKLSHHKPVLLVAGSYTCPVFRNKLQVLNSIAATYAGRIEFAVIYTAEAHPIDTSPYFGYVNVTQFNQSDGILYHQPTNYGERKSICNDLLQHMNVSVPVYLDGPCNEWWSIFGPAPNNAYLIDTNGIVFAKHGWFDRHPDHDIVCDIDSLLGLGSCGATVTGGTFSMEVMSAMDSGLAGDVLFGHVNIINTGMGYVNIVVKKILPNFPSDWETSFCYQVCFSPTDDSVTIQIGPNDTVDFSVDFFTSAFIPDSGSLKVGFRNVDNISNGFSVTFRAYTTEAPASVIKLTDSRYDFSLFPNPSVSGILIIDAESARPENELEIFNIHGGLLEKFLVGSGRFSLNTAPMANGIYFIRLGNTVKKWVKE